MLIKLLLGDVIEVDKMGGLCGMNGRENNCIRNFDVETRGYRTFQDSGADKW